MRTRLTHVDTHIDTHVDQGARRDSSVDSSFDALGEEILVEAAKRSPEAFGALYRRYLPTVYGYLSRRTRDESLAEDLTAATFERAMTALPRYEWRGVPLGAWLVRIASRKLADHFRTEMRRATEPVDPAEVGSIMGEAVEGDGSHADVAQLVADAESTANVIAALERIPPRYREAITLRYLAELSLEEAAEVAGCSKATFAVLVHRSLKALKRAVTEDAIEGAADG